jgi:hypothetical protein
MSRVLHQLQIGLHWATTTSSLVMSHRIGLLEGEWEAPWRGYTR